MYIILLLEGLMVHPKLFRDPLVDRDRRLAQGWRMSSAKSVNDCIVTEQRSKWTKKFEAFCDFRYLFV
jgi:hypothetical protein